jgi:hypothetical protein
MRRRTLVVGVVLLAGAGLVLFCCGGSERRASDATGASPTAPVGTPPAAPAASEAAPLPPSAHASTAAATSSGGAPGAKSSAGARIAQAVSGSDPRDLELLASIERELHRDPPPEVHALVAERKRGATREELARAVQRLPDLELRVLAQRWLDKVAPR